MQQQASELDYYGARKCAEFLSECLKLGWNRDDLDWLESLWKRYHEAHGRLTRGAVSDAAGQ